MVNTVLFRSNPICLVGAGAASVADLSSALAVSDGLVAADGGAELALQSGHVPDAVIGDFDSLSSAVRSALPAECLYHVAEQDSTDFEKALARIKAPAILAVGFTGGRVDHQLAVLHGLLKFADTPCFLLGESEVIFHCPPKLFLEMPAGHTVSLFPLRPVSGTSKGLEWPIDGLDFAPGQQIGTSNRSTGGAVEILMQDRGMIGILPRAHVPALIQSVVDQPRELWRWPAL